MLPNIIGLFLVVTLIGGGVNGQNVVENNTPVSGVQPTEENTRFQKFLNMFGIGSPKHFPQNEQQRLPEYSPYRYPCAVGVTHTTTTPAPLVMNPLLCPYPPMMSPANGKPPHGVGELPVSHSSDVNQFAPPPQHGDLDPQGMHPPQFPGYPPHHQMNPSNLPPPVMIPLQPGQKPPPHFPGPNQSPFPGSNQGPYPGQTQGPFPGNNQGPYPGQNQGPYPRPYPGHHQGPHPGNNQGPYPGNNQGPYPGNNQGPYPGNNQGPFPGQNTPHPIPIHNLPPHMQPGATPSNPHVPILIPGQFQPNGEGEVSRPEPVKVNPVVTNPFDPIKIKPTILDAAKPVHINPVELQPSQPLIVDPTNIQPQKPLLVDPFRPPTSTTGDFLPPPDFNDPKAFSRYPAISPFGPTNVLINPGFPDPPPTTPAPTPSTVRPSITPTVLQPVNKNNISYSRPYTVLLNPGLPVDPPPQHLLNLPHAGFINRPNGVLTPFVPTDAVHPPENIHIIPLMPLQVLPNHFQQGINPYPLQSDKLNETLQPPNSGNFTLPPPPTLYDQTVGKPVVDPIASPLVVEGSSLPSPPFPAFPNLNLPEQTRPPCGTPFLKPYVPHGFHLSSVNQFIGMPPVPNQRFNFLCPTLDLLQTLDFNVMRSLIVSSGLLPLFDHTKNYTLFIPSDAAFRRLPRWFRDSLDVDKKLKKALILNHLIKEDVPLSVLENEELILSARPGGNRLRVNVYESSNTYRTITIDGAEVEKGDILTSNGRVHILNKVLMPNVPRNAAQFLSEKLEFESFWNLVKQAGLVENFQDPRPFTLFIPVNDAIQKLNDPTFLSDGEKLKNFINYHLVNGTYYSNGLIDNEFLLTNYEKEIKMQVTSDTHTKSLRGINGRVRILKSDISLTNGVAHVIDQCISDETPFYVYPQSDEFKNEYGVLRRSFKLTGEEKNIEKSF